MTIECPQCQEKCEIHTTAIPPEGVEVNCPFCSMTFRVRPHLADEEARPRESDAPAASAPAGAETRSALAAAPPPQEDAGFPGRVFLQRDEIPYWMVAAYGEDRGPGSPARPPEESESSFLAQEMHEQTLEAPRDIPILIDEDVAREEFPGELDALPPASPAIGGQIPVRKRGPRKNWKRVGVGVALCVLVVAILLLGRFIWKEVRGRIGNLAGKAVSALHSDTEEKKLQFSDLGHEYVSRGKKEKPVFVIEGKVTNHHSQACHSVQVKGILFDERGKQAAAETAYCGNILKKEEIQSYPPEKIEKALQNVYGAGLSNFDIEPGGAIGFMLVFFDPPEKVSEFSVEIADYKPKGPDGGPSGR